VFISTRCGEDGRERERFEDDVDQGHVGGFSSFPFSLMRREGKNKGEGRRVCVAGVG